MPNWSSVVKHMRFVWRSATVNNATALIENTVETGLFGVFLVEEMLSEILKWKHIYVSGHKSVRKWELKLENPI